MKRIEITVNGTAYPCYPTGGAMLRFHQETGKEITEIDPRSFTQLCTYLWCCVVSASKREGKDFNLSLMDFADSVSLDDMTAWNQALQGGAAPAGEDVEDEKKSL
ncbi:MAG: hypothetical protein K2L21_06135 [Muribaculaceae bacterium]|nr:hypothetical protein [Muribaculaceae bacterium]